MRQRLLVAGTVLGVGLLAVLQQTSFGSSAAQREVPPIRVRFEALNPPKLNEAVPVRLIVERDPKGEPVRIGTTDRLELLLRLPVGVKLESPGWRPAKPSAQEKNDPSGPWFVFERAEPLTGSTGSSPVLAEFPISLKVVEQGLNWVITTRVRLVQGEKAWQTFGVLFATLHNGVAEFHTTPKST